MKNYSILREMNHTYVVINETEETINSDFRFRMLKENDILGIAPMDIRNINGECRLYYDVTDMESLDQIMENHSIDYDDMEQILKGLVLTSSELEKYFCEAENIILIPALIFKNRVTDEYVFICFPSKENENNRYQVSILQFFMEHVEIKDVDAVEGLFEIYDMAISGVKNYKTLYEKLVSYKLTETVEEEIEQESETIEDSSNYKKDQRVNAIKAFGEKYYIPSLRESIAALFVFSGLISIGIYFYLGWT